MQEQTVIAGVQTVLLERLTIDPEIQPRKRPSQKRIEAFATDMGAGAEFPPLVAFWDGVTLWLSDGFHRHAAAHQADLMAFLVDVREGTRREAQIYAIEANAHHGAHFTAAERKAAVLRLEELGLAQTEIARVVGYTQQRVSQLLAEAGITNICNSPGRGRPRGSGSKQGSRKGAASGDADEESDTDIDEDAESSDGDSNTEEFDGEIPSGKISEEEAVLYRIAKLSGYRHMDPVAIAQAAPAVVIETTVCEHEQIATWLLAIRAALLERQRAPALSIVGQER